MSDLPMPPDRGPPPPHASSSGARSGPASGGPPDARPVRIGPYEIVDVLGRGGMGVVYHARQRDPLDREVALKTILTGMDSHEAVRRFESERQAVARMEHPSIAKVFDAGVTPDGRLYFVMEYVDGVPIGEFCDGRRLGTEARLELFSQVCRAVQHAHQKGVIHRDLKPSNVLVTVTDGKPLAKVIDFGIAKATDDDDDARTRLTHAHDAMGTPAYMSPEQIAGAAGVDTRTDVYALGVMLYELLSGGLPYETNRTSGLAGLMERITTDAPPLPARIDALGDTQITVARARGTTPQALRRRLEGDLSWIVMKALERDLDRRYQSADALADDLQRHLAHEPIEARAPTVGYRLRKFVRRNRAAVAAGVVVAVGLMAGSAAATVGMLRALRAEARAAVDARTAERVSDFMVELFNSGTPDQARGREVRAVDLLDRGADRIREDLAAEPVVQARLLSTMGRAYRYLGFRARALEMSREGVANLEAALGPDAPEVGEALLEVFDPAESDADRRARVVRAHAILAAAMSPGDSLWLESFRQSVLARAGCTPTIDRASSEQQTFAFCPDSVAFAAIQGELDGMLAGAVAAHGARSREAAAAADVAAEILWMGRRDPDRVARLHRVAAERFLAVGDTARAVRSIQQSANGFVVEGRWDSLRATFDHARALAEGVAEPERSNLLAGSYLTYGYSYIQEGEGLLYGGGDPADARAALERAWDAYTTGLGYRDTDPGTRASLESQRLYLLRAPFARLDGRIDYDRVLPIQRSIVVNSRALYGDVHPGTNDERLWLARYTRDAGDPDAADSLFAVAVDAAHALVERDPGEASRTAFRTAASEWGELRLRGNGSLAALRREFAARYGPSELVGSDVAHALGNALSRLGRVDEAAGAWRTALELRRGALGAETGEAAGLLINLSAVEATGGRFGAEERLLREAIAVADGAYGSTSDRYLGARNRLLGRLEGGGRYDEALLLYDEIIEALKATYGPGAQQVSGQLVARGLVLTRVGRATEARRSFDEAHRIAASFGDPMEIAQADYGLALVAAESGDPEAALQALARLGPVWGGPAADGPGGSELRAHMHTVAAGARAAAGDSAAARAALDRAVAAYDSVSGVTSRARDRFWIQRPVAELIAELRAERAELGGGG